jgi:predicted ATPase
MAKARRGATGTPRGPFLQEVALKRDQIESFERYPFSLPAVRHLDRLPFHPRVTFLLGENGAGKSTLLEAMAVALELNPEGGSRHLHFRTRDSHSDLGGFLRLVRTPARACDVYFIRSETLYTMATALEDPGLDNGMQGYGNRSLHERSRGEALLAVVTNRLSGGGLYLFDEPEAGLSPTRQLALLAAMHQLVQQGSQLIMATHSPILLSYPDAWIHTLGPDGIVRQDYEQTEHYRVTADFIAHRGPMLRELFGTDDHDGGNSHD